MSAFPTMLYPAAGQRSVLTGRVGELNELRQILVAAENGHGRLVLITGEAGIGKSTLVNSLTDEARSRGTIVLTGSCYDLSTTPPYGPWREIATTYAASGLKQLLPESVQDNKALDELRSQQALFADITGFFAKLSARQTTILVLEDLHWSDAASIDLLRHIARHIANLPMVVAVTYRNDDLHSRHPLFRAIPLLVRESNAIQIELTGLTKDDIRSVVRAHFALNHQDEQRLIAYLDESARGNPFYLGEIVRAMELTRILTRNEQCWSLAPIPDMHVPALIQQFVELRLWRIDPDVRSVLECAAVVGFATPLDILVAVSGESEDRVLHAIDIAREHHILTTSQDGASVSFVHAIVRAALYTQASLSLRRMVHLKTAEMLSHQVQPNPDTVAHHFNKARDVRAIDWFRKAGDEAKRSYAWITAADRYLAAVEILEQQATSRDSMQDRGWLIYQIGRLLRFSQLDRAIGYLEAAEAIGTSIGDDLLTSYCLTDRGMLRCMNVDIRQGLIEARAGVAAIDKAVAHASCEELERVSILVADARPKWNNRLGNCSTRANARRGMLALWLAWTGNYAEAIATGEPVVEESAHYELAPGGYADALHGLAIAQAQLGDAAQAATLFVSARQAYKDVHHHLLEAVTSIDELLNLHLPYAADRPVERSELMRMIDEGTLLGTNTASSNVSRNNFTIAAYYAGDWEAAHEIWLSSRELQDMISYWLNGPATGWIARAQGNRELAWQVIHEGLPAGPDSRPGDGILQSDILRQRLAIQLSLDAQDREAARQWLAAHDIWVESGQGLNDNVERLILRAGFHRAQGQTERALHEASCAVEASRDPYQPLTLQATLRLRGSILTTLKQFADAEVNLGEAARIAKECSAPFEVAQSLLETARLRVLRGDNHGALTLLDQVETTCKELAATLLDDTIALLRAEAGRPIRITHPAGLTRREVEVLQLVAEGLPDADIADRLFISRRTVTSHLTSIYNKLGVSSRTAAVRAAAKLDVPLTHLE